MVLAVGGISIHAPREGSDFVRGKLIYAPEISIHAPREGSDVICFGTLPTDTDFNPRSPRGERLSSRSPLHIWSVISIHAPREGSDRLLPFGDNVRVRFQSTLPARGATA